MSIPSLIKIGTCGAAALAVVAAFSAPSQAQSGGSQASGCSTILEGKAGLVRHIDHTEITKTLTVQFEHAPDLENPDDDPSAVGAQPHLHHATGDYTTYTRDFTDEADATVEVTLDNAAGNDCSSLRYRLRVLDEQRRLVTEVIVPGSTGSTVTWKPTFAYPFAPGRFAYMSVTVENEKGRVLDAAPHTAEGVVVVNLTSGGAASSFK